VNTPPSFDIGGPGTLVMLRNETNDGEIPANLWINDGETVSVNLGVPGMIPGDINVVSDWDARPNKNNLLGKMLAPARMASFDLACTPVAAAGVNQVSIFMADSPVERRDQLNQLSRWLGITGLDSTNTNAGTIYVIIVDDTGGFFHVDIYGDFLRTVLVGHTATYNAAGSQAIVADGASGLGGTIYIDAATAADVNIEVQYSLSTIGHWERYDSLWAAVD
ncbi:MAG TPA: hypothetical protein VMY40_06805, partial [Anaerolineae bacterium]|nr:hypothetical protein [Anaerolineae bacterium]